MGGRGGRTRPAVAVLAGVAALGACTTPFPGTGGDGWTPAIQWVSNPVPATTYLDSIGNGVAVELLREVTRPTASTCTAMNPPVLEHLCDSYYEGSGIVVRVPEVCRQVARDAPDPVTVPRVELVVAGVATSAPAVEPVPLPGGRLTRNAFYVTVAGPGLLTQGLTIHDAGGTVVRLATAATPRVPDQASYDVALTCAAAPPVDGTAGWALTTFTGSIPHGGLPGPL